jgi:hypothetical protein
MRIPIRSGLTIALLVSAGMTWAMVGLSAQGASVIQRGEAIAPVPLNMEGLQSGARPAGQLHCQCTRRLQ